MKTLTPEELWALAFCLLAFGVAIGIFAGFWVGHRVGVEAGWVRRHVEQLRRRRELRGSRQWVGHRVGVDVEKPSTPPAP